MALTNFPVSTDDDGTGQSGTIFNESFFDAIEAAIQAYIVSGTNPSITPAAIIDEVVAAREGEVSLDAKLDAIEALIGVGAVSEANVKALVGARNVLHNGDLEDWFDEDSAIGWGFSDPSGGGSIERTGIGKTDTFHFGTTQYAVKVSRGLGNVVFFRHIIESGDMAAYANVKGQTVAFVAKVKAGGANLARISITDGITTTNSSYHTGGGAEEHLTVVHTISGSATVLTVRAEVNAVGNAYFGGLASVFSPLAPSDWQPFSHPSLASETQRGAIGLDDQILGLGLKKFVEPPVYNPGATDPLQIVASPAVVSGRIHSNVTQVGNVGASGPDILMTYDLPGLALSADGKALRITMWGFTAANANNKAWQVSFGGGTPITSRTAAHNGVSWKIVGEVIRVSNTEVETIWEINQDTAGGSGIVDADHEINRARITGLDFANSDVTIAVQSTVSTADNDVVQSGMIVELIG